MYDLQEKSQETHKEETPNMRTKDGLYAVEIEDNIPPLDTIKFLDKEGNFKDEKPHSTEDLAYYWRSKQRVVSLVLTISSFGLLVILLSATTKYTDFIWDLAGALINLVLSFIIGFIPESAYSWLPF